MNYMDSLASVQATVQVSVVSAGIVVKLLPQRERSWAMNKGRAIFRVVPIGRKRPEPSVQLTSGTVYIYTIH